jgi:hypothetical protein
MWSVRYAPQLQQRVLHVRIVYTPPDRRECKGGGHPGLICHQSFGPVLDAVNVKWSSSECEGELEWELP